MRRAGLFWVATITGLGAGCLDILGYRDADYVLSAGSGAAGGAAASGGTAGGGAGAGGAGGSRACMTDADWAGSSYGETCDTDANECVECLNSDDTCAFGLYCDVTQFCAIGCATDDDCNQQGSGPLVCKVESH